MQGLGAGGRAPHAHQQPRSRGRRASGRPRRLRRHRQGRAHLGRFDVIVASSARSENDETLLVQSGKPVGVLRTHPDAPRVLIANSNLVGEWATWEHFRELEGAGLIMYGQMTAGSWIYIGTQGILQGTYETFARRGRTHFGTDDLAGRLGAPGGLGGMGGAQPLAATMAGAAFLGVEVDPARDPEAARDALRRRALDDLDEALRRLEEARQGDAARSRSGSSGTRRRSIPELVRRGVVPDLVTDQTSAHDPLNGYIPTGFTLAEARGAPATGSGGLRRAREASHGRQVEAMLAMRDAGRRRLRLRQQHPRRRARGGRRRAPFDIPGFVPAYIRPHVLRGEGAVPLGRALRRSRGHRASPTQAVAALFPDERGPAPLDRARRASGEVPGAAGAHLLARLRRARRAGLAFNELVRTGKVKAPIVIGRDHLDCGSVASPNRETEAMKDGSDAIADWPILNALVNTATGASLGELPPRRRRRHRLVACTRAWSIVADGTRGRGAPSSACSRAIRRWASSATPTRATRGDRVREGTRGEDPVTSGRSCLTPS